MEFVYISLSDKLDRLIAQNTNNKINTNKIYDLLLFLIYLLYYNLRAQLIIQHLSYH